MLSFRATIVVTFFLVSQSVSALTISILETTPSSEIWSKVLQEIYNRAEIPLEFVSLPTERSLAQSTRGIIDGELVRIHKVGELYPTLIRVPTPFTFFESRAYSRSPDTQKRIDQDGWNALQEYRVGIVRGMKYASIDLKGIKDVVEVDRTEQLYKMLEHDRVDIALSTNVSGLFLIKKFNFQSVQLLEPVLQTHDLYHYLHEKNKKYIPILDKTIRAMKESGELAELEAKFTAEFLEQK